MNVVIYARYSSHSQTEQSIEGQLAICQEYAKRNDYTIVGEYIDRALTGTNDNRPQFKQMIEDSNKKFFNGVLVYQLDRFARNRYDSAIYKNKLKKNNVRVFSARENISDDASGILMESVLEGMAEYYSAELSQKVKRGRKLNAEKCLSNGGVPSLGYKVDGNQKYIIDEEKASIVKKIFEMYSSGYTMAYIIKYLNDNNYKTALNNEFNKNSLRTILLNKRYTGVYISSGIEVPNGMPRIISDELFNKVAEIMQRNKKAPARAKANYLLTTKLFCGTCNEMLIGLSGTSRNGTVHNYYTCNGRKLHGCKRKNIQKDYIEEVVARAIINELTDTNIKTIADNISRLAEKEKNNLYIKQLEKQLKDNEKQKENLLNSLKICDIDSVKKTILAEIAKMEEQHKNIETDILIENSKIVHYDKDDIEFFLNQMRKLDIEIEENKKLLINTLVDKVFIYDNELTIVFNATKNKSKTIKFPSIEEIEGSFLGKSGAPVWMFLWDLAFHKNIFLFILIMIILVRILHLHLFLYLLLHLHQEF